MGDIIFEPVIPVPLMAVICVVLLVFKRRGTAAYIRQIVTVVLLFAINLRPMYPADNIKVQKQTLDLDVIFVIDDTISMLAEDQEGYDTRMDAAKDDMYYIIDGLPGAKFSVISFNNDTHVLHPFTDSVDYVKNAIDSVYPIPSVYAKGTNISVCVQTLGSVIDSASVESDTARVAVFFLSDGENTDNNPLASFAKMASSVDGGAVLGYGTQEGGQMRYYNNLTEEEELIMTVGVYPAQAAVSVKDEDNLETIASDLEIPYINMGDSRRASRSDLDRVLSDILSSLEADTEEVTRKGYVDLYYLFVIPLVPIAAAEFIILRRKT